LAETSVQLKKEKFTDNLSSKRNAEESGGKPLGVKAAGSAIDEKGKLKNQTSQAFF